MEKKTQDESQSQYSPKQEAKQPESKADEKLATGTARATELSSQPKSEDQEWKEQLAKLKAATKFIDEVRGGSNTGVTRIDDQQADSVRYERTQKDGQPAYDVTFKAGKETVAELKALNANELEGAVGPKNAKTIIEAETNKGTLEGKTLANDYGFSPVEIARRVEEKETRKVEELGRIKADNKAELDPFGPPIDVAKPSGPPAAASKKESEVINSIEPVIEKEASAVKPTDTKPAEKIVIDDQIQEMLARQRAKDRAAVEETLGQGGAAAQPKPAEAEPAAAKPVEKLVIHEETHEMLARQRAKDRAAVEEALGQGGAAAQPKPAEAETSTPAINNKKENNIKSDEILTAEKEPTRPVLPREIEREYVSVGNKYYNQKNPNVEAFEDKGNKLETRSNSEQVAANLVKIAEARGWDEIKVSGTETFRREAWIEASARGMAVKGYTPNEQDKAALAAKVKDMAANTIEQGKTPEAVKTEATKEAAKSDFRARENEKADPEQKGKTIEQQRAESFKNDSREVALKKHPELSGAYAAQAAIHKQMEADGLTKEQKEYAQAKVRENIAKSIETGKIPEVQQRQEVTVKREREVQKTEERELSR